MLLLNCLVIWYKGTCSLLETECWCLSPFSLPLECLNPNPDCLGIRRSGIQEVIRFSWDLEGKILKMRLVSLWEKRPEFVFSVTQRTHNERMSMLRTEQRSLVDTQYAGTFILDCLSTRTVRNKCLLSKSVYEMYCTSPIWLIPKDG